MATVNMVTATLVTVNMVTVNMVTVAGIQGAGLMGAQMSQMSGTDSDIPMDGEQTPNSADPTRVSYCYYLSL